MLQSEFFERTKVDLTGEEYAEVEWIYNNVKIGKDEFCKHWLKLRNNKLFNEVCEGLLRRERELIEKSNSMYSTLNSLRKEYDEYKESMTKVVENTTKKLNDDMENFAKRIIRANNGDGGMVEDVIEEEYGYAFIIKTKHEAGMPLSEAEISYMVGKL